jgi:hypothetical protein
MMKIGSVLRAFPLVFACLVLPATGGTGNGAPSGYHFELNIIGVQKAKSSDMDQAAGNVIFVPLSGRTKIELIEGEDFAVLDKNGTDGVARFQLPDPGLDPYVVGGDMTDVDTLSDYSVFVRPLGKPGGWATITTCAELLDSTFGGLLPEATVDDVLNSPGFFGGFASVEQVGQEFTFRDKGKSRFENVTAQLLTIVFAVAFDLDADGTIEEGEYAYVRVPIFDDSLQGEYWDYDDYDLKLLQVRFYPGVQTDVSAGDADLPR